MMQSAKLPSLVSGSPSSKPFGFSCFTTALVAHTVKNLPAMQETQIQFLGGEDPPEKGMAAHCSVLAWRMPQTEEPSGLQSVGSQRVVTERLTPLLLRNCSVASVFLNPLLDQLQWLSYQIGDESGTRLKGAGGVEGFVTPSVNSCRAAGARRSSGVTKDRGMIDTAPASGRKRETCEQTAAAGVTDVTGGRSAGGGGAAAKASHTQSGDCVPGTDGAWSSRKKNEATQGDQRGAGLASEQDEFQWEGGSLAETPRRAGSSGVGVWGVHSGGPPAVGRRSEARDWLRGSQYV